MTFLKRLKNLAISNLNALVDSMEDPKKSIKIKALRRKVSKKHDEDSADYLHDTAALDTYQRMVEKIEDAENFAHGLAEIASSELDESQKAASRIENELAALKAKLKK